MLRNILCIDILKKDVYIEYTNREFEYVSFTKAKKIVFTKLPSSLYYSCVDEEKSVAFLNSLLTRYTIQEEKLICKNY